MNFMENIKKIQNQSEKKYTQLKILRVYTYIYTCLHGVLYVKHINV